MAIHGMTCGAHSSLRSHSHLRVPKRTMRWKGRDAGEGRDGDGGGSRRITAMKCCQHYRDEMLSGCALLPCRRILRSSGTFRNSFFSPFSSLAAIMFEYRCVKINKRITSRHVHMLCRKTTTHRLQPPRLLLVKHERGSKRAIRI